MKFNSNDFIWLYGHMWVHVPTCEKMLILDDLAISLDGLIGKKVFLPEAEVEELCAQEERVDNWIDNQY